MNRSTGLATALTAAALAASAVATPAMAEAVVYETKNIRSNPPDRPGHEYASLDVPTGYERDRLNWHTVGFFEEVEGGRSIIMDLHPKADTLEELRAKRARVMERAGDSYREFAFRVNHIDAQVRARWVYTYQEAGTGDTEPFISVLLMRGNQLRIVGKVSEREHVRAIREHVRKSVTFPS